MKKYIVMLATLFAVLLVPSQALAARSSIAVDPTSIVGDSINFQETVNFVFTSRSDRPWIQLHCYQDGILVLSASRAGYEGGYGYQQPFVLGPTTRWVSGGATCLAEIGYVTYPKGTYKVENNVEFNVLP